ncbi:hypothetical protein IMCC1989_2451 [gamma proteobacterium IMCC1989]|nr:hypothetical protein IMCC1989_2451 [gamma proteobacterium IMCC1989]
MEKDESLEQEVNAIYHAIQEREDFIRAINIDMDKGENPKRQRNSRILFYASIIFIALSYTFIKIEQSPSANTVIIASVGVLIGYLLMLGSIAIDFFKLKKDLLLLIKNPLSLLFDGFRQTAGNDVAFAQALQNYSTRSLVIVKNRLSSQSTTVQHRVSSLVGPLSKLGLLPSLLALSITFLIKNTIK